MLKFSPQADFIFVQPCPLVIGCWHKSMGWNVGLLGKNGLGWWGGISNHWQLDYLFNSLLRQTTNKTSKRHSTGPFRMGNCEENPPVTGGFSSKRASRLMHKLFPCHCISIPIHKCHLSSIGVPIIKIRGSHDILICNSEMIPICGKTVYWNGSRPTNGISIKFEIYQNLECSELASKLGTEVLE